MMNINNIEYNVIIIIIIIIITIIKCTINLGSIFSE